MRGHFATGVRLGLASCIAVMMMTSLPAQAEDISVKQRLDSVGQKYEVDKDGDFKITFTFTEDKRSQIVFISGKPYDVLNGVAVRNVFAPVAKVQDDNVAARAFDLLKLNNGFAIGSYEVEGTILLFSIKVPDNATASQLVQAARTAATVADEKEKEISGARDTF